MDAHNQTPELDMDAPVGCLERLVRPSSEYRYLGDFASCSVWAARPMTCDTCRTSWTGCWDNFICPECGEGELPSCEPTGMTLGKFLNKPTGNVPPLPASTLLSVCHVTTPSKKPSKTP